MSRRDLEKVKADEAKKAAEWYEKEKKESMLKGLHIPSLSSFMSKVMKSVRYNRHQGEREKARRLHQYPSLDLARIWH